MGFAGAAGFCGSMESLMQKKDRSARSSMSKSDPGQELAKEGFVETCNGQFQTGYARSRDEIRSLKDCHFTTGGTLGCDPKWSVESAMASNAPSPLP